MKLLPREKLVQEGVGTLEDHELLSVILGRGTKKESVFSLTQRVLKGFDREELIQEKNFASFQKKFRLSPLQACQMMASVELGKRLFQKPPTTRQIQNVKDVYQVVRNMQYLKKEYVRGLYLNSRYRIIHDEIISIGSLDSNILHPREIFRPAIEYSAFSLILAHNHPSGDPRPSEADKKTTKQLMKIGDMLQIPLSDHIIIGENDYFSFCQYGLL